MLHTVCRMYYILCNRTGSSYFEAFQVLREWENSTRPVSLRKIWVFTFIKRQLQLASNCSNKKIIQNAFMNLSFGSICTHLALKRPLSMASKSETLRLKQFSLILISLNVTKIQSRKNGEPGLGKDSRVSRITQV